MRAKAGEGFDVYLNGQKEDFWVTADEEAGEIECYYYCHEQIDGQWGFSIAYFPESDNPLPTYTKHGKVEIRKR